jgi:CheY-like chemotaxis protein
VRDTGEGIRPEVLPRIFDLFARAPVEADRSRGGLGVGLTLVKRLMELHGGSVSVESAGPGRGSEFTIRLPVNAGEGPHGGSAPAHDSDTSTRRRVLIVDDSEDARESLRLLLELGGHEVETAEDGSTGLAKLHTFRPDVALIDLALPGIDGYALARAARQSLGSERIRLIALTGYGDVEDREKAMAAGFDVHVTKPVDPEHLENLLMGRA